MNEIRYYIDGNGNSPFAAWRRRIRDLRTRLAIDTRIMRMETGNFGDHKLIRNGVWEMRIDTGPGYRIYYAKAGLTLILLLSGGDKHSQPGDIERACDAWLDWKRCNPRREE